MRYLYNDYVHRAALHLIKVEAVQCTVAVYWVSKPNVDVGGRDRGQGGGG